MICSTCGEENPDRFRLCGFCGAELPRPAALETRKVVTLVFADVTGSTALGERLDPESVRWVMSSFFELAREVLERHGGTVEKFIGDAVMAAFGIPLVHEDDALRGVRAARELRDRLRELGHDVEARFGTGIGVRIGVNTGEVVAGDPSSGQAFASGDAVNVAARLEQAAAPGQVLIGARTLRLVRDAVTVEPVAPLDLKGKGTPVAAWLLVEVDADRPGVARALGAPLVGREPELRRLLDAFDGACGARDARMATIVAHAGVGKTRLMAELIERVQPAAEVLVGRCLAYGEGITFWPIAEALRQATGESGDLAALLEGESGAAEILERIAPVLGLPGSPVALEETFWAIRKLFEALARRRPLVVILDDVHWAEATLLDLVEYIAGWTRGVPFLLVCATRPELLERRPSLVSPRSGSTTLVLEPLAAGASDELMAWQLGGEPISSALGRRILSASQGNPLFVQELVRMLVEDRLIERRDGSWQATGDVHELAMPPTIQALLAARLDQLEPGARDVAERGAVIGHVFSWSAVRELCPERARSELGSNLHALVRTQLIVPETGPDASEDAFRFGHMLVRDAAYAGVAKRTRAELHERFARWLESATSDRLTENAEILGYHLEQAVAYRRELGDLADATRIAAQASERLAEGGRRALAAGDLPAAANLLGRAAEILDRGDPSRLALRLDSVPALVEIGRFELADAALGEILAAPQQTSLQVAARAWQAFLGAQRDVSSFEACEATAEAWRAMSERDGDHGGQASALGFLAKMQFWGGRARAAEALWLRAAGQARLADDRREEADALVWTLIAGMFGPTPVPEALERCAAIAGRDDASQKVRIMASIERGVLEAMQGAVGGGRERVARGRAELEELGLTWLAAVMSQEATTVEELADEPARAEALLRPSIATFERMGDGGFESTHLGLLARALQQQGRHEEGAAVSARQMRLRGLEEGAVDNDDSGLTASTRALDLAREGRHAEALRHAEQGVRQAAGTDFIRELADRHVDLAEVHALAGRRDEALASLDEADALYARKGCVAAIDLTARRRSTLG